MSRIHQGNRDKLNNAIFSQVAQLHVPKCLPWANHCDVCSETLHAGDVISEPMWENRLR